MANDNVNSTDQQIPDPVTGVQSISGQPPAPPQFPQPGPPAGPGQSTQPAQQTGQPPVQVVAAHPRANIFHEIFQTLGGGDKIQYTVDPQTGTMSQTKVPQTTGQLAKSVIAGALTGLFAGAGEKGPGATGRAFAAGGQAAMQQKQTQDAQARQQAEQDYDRQQKQLVQKAQIFKNNADAALTIQQTEKLGDERMDSYIGLQKPRVDLASEQGRIIAGEDRPVTQEEAKEAMSTGKYNPGEVMFVPTARVPRLNPDGSVGQGSELVGVVLKDGQFDPKSDPEGIKKAQEYGLLPAKNVTSLKDSQWGLIANKVAVVDNARAEMKQVHDKLGTAADSMPNFDEAIKTPGMAEALSHFQSYLSAAKGFDPAVAINLMSQEKQSKTGQMVKNPDAKYVPLIYKAFGGQDVVDKYEKTIAIKPTKMDETEAETILSDPKSTLEQKTQAQTVLDLTAKQKGKEASATETAKDAAKKEAEKADNELIDSIGTGKMAPERLGYILGRKPELMSAVVKAYPDFDSSKAASYPKTYTDFTSGKTSRALNSGGTALRHLKEAVDLNTPASMIPGTPAHTKYENKIDTLASELSTFYKGGGAPTNEDIKGIKDTLMARLAWNRNGALLTQAKSMGDKIDSYETTWKNAAPSPAYQAPMPNISKEAKEARATLDPEYKKRYQQEMQTPQVGAAQKGGFDFNKFPVAQ